MKKDAFFYTPVYVKLLSAIPVTGKDRKKKSGYPAISSIFIASIIWYIRMAAKIVLAHVK